jgi:hypothetical protein
LFNSYKKQAGGSGVNVLLLQANVIGLNRFFQYHQLVIVSMFSLGSGSRNLVK